MIVVKVSQKIEPTEALNRALKTLSKKWKNSNMDSILRSNESFEKPSAIRRRQKHAAIRRHQKMRQEEN